AYIKTSYKEDPIFKNSKVVYSLYNDAFEGKLSNEFTQKAVTGSMKIEDLSHYGTANHLDLYNGAIHYSDALFLAEENIDEQLLKIVKNVEIPVIDVKNDDDFENYCNLYEEFASEELETLA